MFHLKHKKHRSEWFEHIVTPIAIALNVLSVLQIGNKNAFTDTWYATNNICILWCRIVSALKILLGETWNFRRFSIETWTPLEIRKCSPNGTDVLRITASMLLQSVQCKKKFKFGGFRWYYLWDVFNNGPQFYDVKSNTIELIEREMWHPSNVKLKTHIRTYQCIICGIFGVLPYWEIEGDSKKIKDAKVSTRRSWSRYWQTYQSAFWALMRRSDSCDW